MRKTKYIDLMTDFGFKRLFKTSSNKDILIAFLNDLFNGREVITDLENYPSGYPDDSEITGNVIFNVLCSTDEGEQIAVQMQRTMESDIRQRILHSVVSCLWTMPVETVRFLPKELMLLFLCTWYI